MAIEGAARPELDPARVRAHQVALAARARRLGFRGAEVDEVTQSTWATFLAVLPRFGGRSEVRTFLIGILQRKALEARRGSARARRLAAIPPSELVAANADAPDAEAALSAREAREALRGCVETLPHKERRAVELRLLGDDGGPGAMRALGITANYLGVLLHRARAHLRECLGAHLS